MQERGKRKEERERGNEGGGGRKEKGKEVKIPGRRN